MSNQMSKEVGDHQVSQTYLEDKIKLNCKNITQLSVVSFHRTLQTKLTTSTGAPAYVLLTDYLCLVFLCI